MFCPTCGSEHIVKNGHIHNGKQKYACKNCGKQFVENPENVVSQEQKNQIDRLLLERIPLAGIARSTGVSERWLQDYANQKYEAVPKKIVVTSKPKGKLRIQCDFIKSFVFSKKNKFWIWLAIDEGTREIVGIFIGKRDKEGARGLWDSLPPVYRQCAVCYTDFWEAYHEIFPQKRHRPVSKKSGQTNRIERFNGTMRQRIDLTFVRYFVSRLVRKSLSFSKKVANHIGAIWYFIPHYNANLAPVQ